MRAAIVRARLRCDTSSRPLAFVSRLCLYLIPMKKIAVYIADQQDTRLKQLARVLGIKQAELLRRCLEEGLARIEGELRSRTRLNEPSQRNP